MPVDMDTIVSLCKRRGFVFQSAEIYGGLGGFWDYGPLGVEMKNNVKRAWWKAVVQEREDMVGLDSSIITNPRVWVASGHVALFGDMMVDCKECKKRFRTDDLTGDRCPECNGELTEARKFQTMFKTFVGPVEDDASVAYLRPETCQSIFTNFVNILNTSRKKLPFGIAQIGKAFRNEITPGNFIFRDREFEQMEIEYFVHPQQAKESHHRWLEDRLNWFINLGMRRENLRVQEHEPDKVHLRSGEVLRGNAKRVNDVVELMTPDGTQTIAAEEVVNIEKGELAHYSPQCFDIQYNFPMGWSELEGIANRTDFDLTQHSEHSGEKLTYFDPETNEHVIPYVIEPSLGVDRCFLAFLLDAYHEEQLPKEKRTVLKFHKDLAPIKVAVLPLARNRPEIVEMAKKISVACRKRWSATYDDTAAIGRLYRRQDEIGTLYCVTVDHQSALPNDEKYDGKVTIRDRDTMEQIRVSADQVVNVLREKLDE